jgi:hypothetical protein
MRRLFAFEMRWLLTLLDTIFPAGCAGRVTLGARDVALAPFFRDVFRHAPLLALLGVRGATWLLTFSPLWRWGWPVTFGMLAPARRLALLEALAHSRFYLFRELPMLLKTLGGLGWGSAPAFQRMVGVDAPIDTPDWMQEAR